ncbi:beta-N-acetylhexosaminidase [Chromatiales bacterium (ex Bugula neritina AB1)]|nr:beta-N-acetylhexosaminidase [Chromatiales bacterium (ex Bugula neritina AB1)]
MTETSLAGPLMIDVAGIELTAEDRELIAHPNVSGVILFARNYQDRAQLISLVREIRAAQEQPLLVAVDQEGGRVQRFREGFTRIPPMRCFGQLYDQNPQQALEAVKDVSRLLAWELRACDIDFSFAPVLDLDHNDIGAIGDRAFHHDVEVVSALARAAISGFREAGCASVVKHFPGHGSVSADTHLEFAYDRRSYDEIFEADMKPFRQLLTVATAVMPAHVIYPLCDPEPASLSRYWQTEILRETLGFNGPVISDDMSMAAVTGISPQAESAVKALRAGTDLVLVCNDRQAAMAAIEQPLPDADGQTIHRRQKLRAKMVESPADSLLAAARSVAESLV